VLRRFLPSELKTFLAAVDAALPDRVFMILLGGGAAALGYGVRSGTKDLDTLTEISEIEAAIQRAREQTGLSIPVEPTPVADLPDEFESRLVRVLPDFRHLELLVPEAHDLALSKLVRAHAGDLAALEELHARHPLSFDTLVARYRDEMSQAIGNPVRLEQNFLLGVHVLFGEIKRDEAKRLLRRR
jgi:hypothetical protein